MLLQLSWFFSFCLPPCSLPPTSILHVHTPLSLYSSLSYMLLHFLPPKFLFGCIYDFCLLIDILYFINHYFHTLILQMYFQKFFEYIYNSRFKVSIKSNIWSSSGTVSVDCFCCCAWIIIFYFFVCLIIFVKKLTF